MQVRPVLEVRGNTVIAVEVRGAGIPVVLADVALWRVRGIAVDRVILPVDATADVVALEGQLAVARVSGGQVSLSVGEDRLDLPGMRDALATARARCGVTVIVTGVGDGSGGALGSSSLRASDVLCLTEAVWDGAATDPTARERLARIVALSTDLGWEVWARDVARPADVALLRAAGVHAVCGDGVVPWGSVPQLVERLRRPAVVAATAPPPARTPAPVSIPAPAPPPARTPAPAPPPASPPPPSAPPAAKRRRSRLPLVVGAILALALVGFLVHRAFIPFVGDGHVGNPVVDGGHSQLARQGFNLTAWGDDDYNSRHAREALNQAIDLGANTVAIVVTEYVDDPQAVDIHPVEDKTPSTSSLKRVIRLAKQMGFYVSIKPHIDTLSGDWRGDIDPDDFNAFADEYTDYILRYARLAQDAGADELVAGTELKKLTHRMATDERDGTQLIADIRDVFDGTVGYAANWDNVAQVPFWDKVDFIGIDAYYPLGDATDVDSLVAAWQPDIDQARELAQRYDKPLVLTEAGYQNRDGASETPWGTPEEATLDDEEQVNSLQALFIAWGQVPELEGIYLWQLYAGNPADLDPGDWSVVGKPAADVVDDHFGGD